MGWGDLARDAMNKALEAYKASVVVTERLQHLLESFRAMEGRITSNQQDFERRLREMESRVARLEGRVDAALAEAFKAIITTAPSSASPIVIDPSHGRVGDGQDATTRTRALVREPPSQ